MRNQSCVTLLLCDPGWYIQRTDVQNKREEEAHTQHTTTTIDSSCFFVCFLFVSHYLRPMSLDLRGYLVDIVPVVTKERMFHLSPTIAYDFFLRGKFRIHTSSTRLMAGFYYFCSRSHAFRYGNQNSDPDFVKTRTHDLLRATTILLLL